MSLVAGPRDTDGPAPLAASRSAGAAPGAQRRAADLLATTLTVMPSPLRGGFSNV